MKTEKELEFLSSIALPFSIETCQGMNKEFKDLTTWELLNLKLLEVLNIPTRLHNEDGISPSFFSIGSRSLLSS